MTNTVEEPKSEIQQFFSGTNVFVTGATGFLGHVVVEKLLRTCYIKKLYILIRPKKDKKPQDRVNEMFNGSLFKLLLEKQPNFMEKVVPIVGDCVEPNLGLSKEDEEFLVANMNVVIHCAATINLNGPLKYACFINVRSTRDLLLMAQRMPNLKSFVYVSTAFSNPYQPVIQEIIYDCHIKADILISMVENLPDSIITSITPQIIGNWPNTYTLSKAVGENMIKDNFQNMPIIISRPCLVVFTLDDPIEGWAINMNSVPGLCVGVGLGAVHTVNLNFNTYATIMPADLVSNMIITSAWHASKIKINNSIPVLNHVPQNMAPPLSYGECLESIVNIIDSQKLYSKRTIWKPFIKFTDSKVLFTLFVLLYHYLPAFLGDIYLRYSGKKPRAVKLYRKLDSMMSEMTKIGINEFKFDDTRLKEVIKSQSSMDKKLFNMDVSNISWKQYFLKGAIGYHRHILKETRDDPKAIQRYKKITVARYILKTVLYGFALYLFSLIIKSVFY